MAGRAADRRGAVRACPEANVHGHGLRSVSGLWHVSRVLAQKLFSALMDLLQAQASLLNPEGALLHSLDDV